jgi:hypothetical protein
MPTEMETLWPVIVGGGIAIVAGIVGPYLIQRTKDAADKKRKRAEKFEELVSAVSEHYHWFAIMRYFFISGQGSQPPLSPIIRIEAIVSTYFPEFEEWVRRLDIASNRYEVWILNVGQKRVRNEAGYEKLDGHDEVLTNYTDVRNNFLGKLRGFARRKFQ